MLERLTLLNFQAHQRVELELDPYVTTIIGPSDVGKSSILRGLEWLCFNNMSPKECLRHGAKSVTGILQVDGRTIRKRRGKRNLYSLDGKEFQAVGTDVPQEVASLLNVNDLNFQRQMDAPFWFCLTPGQTSKELNKIVNLGLIDSSLSYLNSEVRQASTRVQVSQERLDQATEELQTLEYVPEFLADLEQLTEQETKKEEKARRLATLSNLCQQAATASQQADLLGAAQEDGLQVVELANRAKEAREQFVKLALLLDTLSEAQEYLEMDIPDLRELDEQKTMVDQAAHRRDQLVGLIEQLIIAGERQCQSDKDLKEARCELERMTKGRCPLCGATIGS